MDEYEEFLISRDSFYCRHNSPNKILIIRSTSSFFTFRRLIIKIDKILKKKKLSRGKYLKMEQ